MRMALKDGQVQIIELSQNQFALIRSWGLMRWDRSSQMMVGPATVELLNKLARTWRLPDSIDAERKRLNALAAAVDAERMDPDPEPVYPYPVKQKLYKHQIRGANMALLTFGLVAPEEDKHGAQE